ncbi:MAG: hypoxanthine phosphoribosyltransferase [Candidatus Melainabacteria bacterium]
MNFSRPTLASRAVPAPSFGQSAASAPHSDTVAFQHPQPAAENRLEVRLSDERINNRVRELAGEINRTFTDSDPLVVLGVMKGALVFTSDLIKQLNMPCQLELVTLSSYGNGDTSSGRVNGSLDHLPDLSGRDVLIVEDILDTGHTLTHLTGALKDRYPEMNQLKTAVLLDKPERRETPFEADFTGFTVANEFLVGRGLDYQGLYRNLPDVAVLKGTTH